MFWNGTVSNLIQQALPYERLFRILIGRKLEREQKFDKARGGRARKGTLVHKAMDFE